jgi:shikimate kinase
MNNITLIGMPGVGKSTLGVVLAKVLGYEFLDSDLLIQKQEKKKLYEIIAESGTDGFQEIENRVNASIDTDQSVIATGGSVVYCKDAMEHLKSIGKVVYLEISLQALHKRLGNLEKRGVVLKDGQTLADLYKERIPLYEKYADLVINLEGKDLEASLQEILATLGVEVN